MKAICLIPARMGSSRFPGKPMSKILGIPMIEHVYRRSKLSYLVDDVYVATCDKEIYDFITSLNGKAVMTSNKHERASDRCAEALHNIEKNKDFKYDFIVMVQGDEPMINPNMINESLEPMFNDKKIKVTNLMGKIKDLNEFNDRNCIKVVVDKNNYALYFSREPIPSRSKGEIGIEMKQICVIPFSRNCLLDYVNLAPTKLEIVESIDMMRFLENGIKVKMIETKYQTFAVDEEKDKTLVETLLREDKVFINNFKL